MHTGLGKPGDTNGWMHRQLADVAACLVAFATDLGAAFNKVQRGDTQRIRPARQGERWRRVDHGLGQAVLAFGGGISGGRVMDSGPLANASLSTAIWPSPLTTARSAEILAKRCGLSSATSVFPGFSPAAVASPGSP